jgi:hypothetical protein
MWLEISPDGKEAMIIIKVRDVEKECKYWRIIAGTRDLCKFVHTWHGGKVLMTATHHICMWEYTLTIFDIIEGNRQLKLKRRECMEQFAFFCTQMERRLFDDFTYKSQGPGLYKQWDKKRYFKAFFGALDEEERNDYLQNLDSRMAFITNPKELNKLANIRQKYTCINQVEPVYLELAIIDRYWKETVMIITEGMKREIIHISSNALCDFMGSIWCSGKLLIATQHRIYMRHRSLKIFDLDNKNMLFRLPKDECFARINIFCGRISKMQWGIRLCQALRYNGNFPAADKKLGELATLASLLNSPDPADAVNPKGSADTKNDPRQHF